MTLLRQSITAFTIAAILFPAVSIAAKGDVVQDGYAIESFVQDWYEKPVLPSGWALIDSKSAQISNNEDVDVFMLATDGKNELLLWFHKPVKYWQMTIIDSIETNKHIAYGIKPSELRIEIKENAVLYGIEGSEAITSYRWDNEANPSRRRRLFQSFEHMKMHLTVEI